MISGDVVPSLLHLQERMWASEVQYTLLAGMR